LQISSFVTNFVAKKWTHIIKCSLSVIANQHLMHMSVAESKPAISIIVPVHNVEDYIDRCIRSLIGQTIFPKMEIILVENGSTDNSEAICRGYSARHPNIITVVNQETGLSEARNFGVPLASAEVIGFVDSDDYVEPDMFESLLSAKNEHGADIAYCNFLIERDNSPYEYPFADSGLTVTREIPEVVYNIIMEISTSASWARIYDKSFFSQRKFPEKKCYEDHSTIYRWMSQQHKIVHVDRPLYHYCIRKDSITTTTKGNPSKILDYFNAEFGRMEFASNYDGWNKKQRDTALRHIAHQCYIHLKRYIKAIGSEQIDNPELISLRHKYLEFSRFSIAELGLKEWLNVRKVKHCWNNFYDRYKNRPI